MLENLHSGHTTLSEAESDHFGVDPTGVQAVEDADYQVDIVPPLISLSDSLHSYQILCQMIEMVEKISSCNVLISLTCL